MARSKKNSAASGDQVVHLHVGKGESSEREADEDEVEALDALEDGQLSRAIEEIRQVEGAKAEVYRVSPPDRQGHCRVYPVSMFSLERVGSDYGPGKYRVRFKGPGDKYIKGGGTFDIAESLQSANTAGGGATPNAIQDFIALMKERDARELADREKKTGQWIEWAKIIAPLALPKILDMIGGGAGKGTSLPDMIRAVKDLRELQAPQQDLKSQFGEVVSILQGAKELVGDDGGKQATGSTWVDLIRDLAGSPAAGALVQALSGAMPRPSLPLPSPTAATARLPHATAPPRPVVTAESAPSTAPGSSPTQPPPADVGLLAQLQWLQGTLSQLLVQAQKQANPRLYAEVVLDNLPPEVPEAALFERLSKEDWLAQLAQIDGAVLQHAEWFGKFRDYLVRALRRKARREAESAPETNGAMPSPPNAHVPPLPAVNQPMAEGDQFE
jgi:hypothetical protein